MLGFKHQRFIGVTLWGFLCVCASACAQKPPATRLLNAQTPTPILVFGDSLSAGFNIPAEQKWSQHLESRLRTEGMLRPDQHIANASVSGETTTGGLQRFPEELAKSQPVVVILQLGANDALRRQFMATMKNNLEQMVSLARQSNATVILVGVKPMGLLSLINSSRFTEVYAQVAREQSVIFVPNLFDDVSSSQIQDDHLHPTAQAQPHIAQTVYPAVVEASQSTF